MHEISSLKKGRFSKRSNSNSDDDKLHNREKERRGRKLVCADVRDTIARFTRKGKERKYIVNYSIWRCTDDRIAYEFW